MADELSTGEKLEVLKEYFIEVMLIEHFTDEHPRKKQWAWGNELEMASKIANVLNRKRDNDMKLNQLLNTVDIENF